MRNFAAFVLVMLACIVYAEMPTRGICAHRGDNALFPENTIPALVSAAKKGAAMVELDVYRCKTGELLLMHNSTVDATTNGKGKIANLTFDEVRALDAGIKRGEQFAGTKVPTFEEALDALPKDGIWINCHVQSLNIALDVAKIIQKKERLHQAFLAVPVTYVTELRAAVPGIKICNMSRTGGRNKASWTPELHHKYAQTTVDNKCEFIQLLLMCPPSDIKLMKDAGVNISLFKCDDPNKLKELLDAGVDFILTDKLDVMLAKWKELDK